MYVKDKFTGEIFNLASWYIPIKDNGEEIKTVDPAGVSRVLRKLPEADANPVDTYILSGVDPNQIRPKNPKKSEVEKKVSDLLALLNLDLDSPNLKDTPRRITKMLVDELLVGCYTEPPPLVTFPNEKHYSQMIIVGPIKIKSICAHHFLPFIGQCFVGYIPNESLLGLSKFSRVVRNFMRRPQIQEELTEQISSHLWEALHPVGCGTMIVAEHLCMSIRGVEEENSEMTTTSLKGGFLTEVSAKNEFLSGCQKRIGK